MMEENHEVAQREAEVPFPPKGPIKCLQSAKQPKDLSWAKTSMIFTHGAGGTLQAEAIVNFTHGFVLSKTMPALFCFKGNMNLASRTRMFSAIVAAREASLNCNETYRVHPVCLGGRSMGARAAVQAVTENTTHLALISYPLQSKQETRDRILLELPASVKVIFITGDRDQMCDLERLEGVRRQMKCRTWRVVVRDADHGMNVRPKPATRAIGEMTGALVATWLGDCNESLSESVISWDSEKSIAQWSGWMQREKTLDSMKSPATQAGTSQKSSPEYTEKDSRRKKPRNEKEVLESRPKRRRKD